MVWPRNCRVSENSPILCPTMFSVMYTGMNCLPLCTASVCPTISGEMVERRAHVLSTRFSPFMFIFVIRWSSRSSMNGPFFVLLGMFLSLFAQVLAPAQDQTRAGFLALARLATVGKSPRAARRATSAGLAFAATERVVDRIHCHAAHARTLAKPARTARLARHHVF